MIHRLANTTWKKITNLDTLTGRVSLSAATNFIIAIMNFATGALVARLLGPTGRGELAAIQMIPLLVASLAMLGMSEAVVYFSSRQPKRAGIYLTSAQAIIAVSGIGFVSVGWWFMPRLLHAQSVDVVQAARIFLLLMSFLYGSIGLMHHVLRSVGAWQAWNILRILPHVAWLFGLLSVFVVSAWNNPVSLSRMYIVAHLVLIIPFVIVTRRYIARPYKIQPNLFRPLLKYGIPSTLSELPYRLNLQLDQILMTTLVAPQLLGLYVVAVAWSNATKPLFGAIGPVLFPHISSITEPGQKHKVLSSVIHINILAIVVIVVLHLLVTPWALPFIFGSEYQGGLLAALILIVASGFSNLNLTLADGLRGLGQPQRILTAETIGLGVTIITLIILIPMWNIVGAAIASLLAYASVCGYLFWSTYRIAYHNLSSLS